MIYIPKFVFVKIIGLELIVLKLYQVRIPMLKNDDWYSSFFRFLAPAAITHVSNPMKILNPITTIKSLRNLTQTSFITDLNDYFDWPKTYDGITKATKSYHLISKSPIPPSTSKSEIQINWFFLFLNRYFYLEHSPCLSTPCLHNSTCVILSDNVFRCLCSPSFIGIYCEIGKYLIIISLIFHLTFLIHAEILNIAYFRKFS